MTYIFFKRIDTSVLRLRRASGSIPVIDKVTRILGLGDTVDT